MLQTLERTNTFDARVLTASHAGALRELTVDTGLPLLPCLHPALEEGQIVGDYAGQGEDRDAHSQWVRSAEQNQGKLAALGRNPGVFQPDRLKDLQQLGLGSAFVPFAVLSDHAE